MKGRILVVDEDAAVRQTLEEILRLKGYQLRLLSSGNEALEALEEETYDLMILDVKLPGMDGIDVVRAARQMTPDTQVILLTGHGSLESAIEAIRHDVHDYLLKPVPTDVLLNSVTSAMARREHIARRRLLLQQMEASLQQLKGVERYAVPALLNQPTIALGEGLMIDLARREIWSGQKRVSLTPTEGALMKVLIEHRGQVLSHRQLVSLVQGYDASDQEAPEVLRPLISRLRRKLATFGADEWISNVRGTGYLLRELNHQGIGSTES